LDQAAVSKKVKLKIPTQFWPHVSESQEISTTALVEMTAKSGTVTLKNCLCVIKYMLEN